MFQFKNKKKIVVVILAILGIVGLGVGPVLAQVDTGLQYGAYTGLVNTDIRIIVAKIIRAVLGLLGILVLAYFLYGGYLYLTAGGNEDRIKDAKKIFKNALIGLAIALSSFSIAQFVISRLSGAIIDNYCAQNPSECVDCINNPTDPRCPITPGCTIPGGCNLAGQAFYATVAPQGSVPIYNVVVDVQFSSAFGSMYINRSTVTSDSIKIVKRLADGSFETLGYPGKFTYKNDSLVSFHPTGNCGDGVTGNDCFEKNTTYKVILSSSITSAAGGANLDCSTHSCEVLFTTGDKYDAIAPTVDMVLPGNWAVVGSGFNNKVSANYSDDSGVKQISFYYKNSQGASTDIVDFLVNPSEVNGSRQYDNWSPILQDSNKAETGEVYAVVSDLDNHHTTSTSQQVRVIPAWCFNGVLDTDKGEQQIGDNATGRPDCGVTSECGACLGNVCDSNLDCAGTYCDLSQHKCVERPKIIDFSPRSAGAGSLVTIVGSNFGDTPGSVLFNGLVAPIVACPLTGSNPTWNNQSVVVRVPSNGPVNGPLEIRKNEFTGLTDLANFDKTDDDWGINAAFLEIASNPPGLICVDPSSQSPTHIIRIAGENLGADKGKVKFGNLMLEGSNIASWQTDGKQINVAVPNLPAQVLSLSAVTTNNEITNALPFTVEPVPQTLAPSIDYLDPEKGPIGTYITVFGRNFGETGAVAFKRNINDSTESAVFADLPPAACGTVWKDTQVIIKVPAALTSAINAEGVDTLEYYVQVRNSIGNSNWQKFTLNKDDLRPGLCKIQPDNGPINTSVTFLGEGFGPEANRGLVKYWDNIDSPFSSLDPLPSYKTWSNTVINDKVPASAKTGAVKIWSEEKDLFSNTLNFKVQNCKNELAAGRSLSEICGTGEKCCGNGVCSSTCPEETGARSSVFAWSFATGQYPIVPKVVERCGKFCVNTGAEGSITTKTCSKDNDCSVGQVCLATVPSPSPSTRWPNSNNVCINAEVKALFNTTINNNGNTLSEANANDILFVYKCLNDGCALTESSQIVPGNYSLFVDNGGTGLTFNSLNKFTTSTIYQAIITTNVKSDAGSLGANMLVDSSCPNLDKVFGGKQAAYCFKFKTNENNALCTIGSVVVTPAVYSTSTLGRTETALYDASALSSVNECVVLGSSSYDWRWNPSDETTKDNISFSQYFSISNGDADNNSKVDATDQDLTIKNLSTPSTQTVTATWNDDPEHTNFVDKIFGRAFLNILPSRPKIINHYPDCNSACTNAAVGYEFDTPVKYGNNLEFYKCNDANCDTSEIIFPNYDFIQYSNDGFYKGVLIKENLLPNTLYQVVVISYTDNNIAHGARNTSGATMSVADLNYPAGAVTKTGFSWMFRTKDDNSACGIDSIEVQPNSATVNVIGGTAEYSAVPRGKPDNCSAKGQLLRPSFYNWSWTSDNISVATVSLLDRGPRLKGSESLGIFCGNGRVDAGEDCDSLSNINCGVNCRLITKGTTSCSTSGQKVNCCGNEGSPEFNEDCDLGSLNGVPGSGCSFNCLFTKVPISLNYCLYKNNSITDLKQRKDDCLARWGATAICGNSGSFEDGEECDDGSSNGQDGTTCSSKCLLKARYYGSTYGSCGDGIIQSDNNEQCDGDIGCGSDCRWDFLGDSKIDPIQYAKAVGLGTVDPVTKQQSTQINARVDAKTGSANFILQCGYTPLNSNCPSSVNNNQGAGNDSCCHLRPNVLDNSEDSDSGKAEAAKDTWPRTGFTSGICPNAKLSVRFDQEMNINSFVSSTAGQYNIVLAKATSTPTCGAGTFSIGYKEKQPNNWWEKIKFSARRFLGKPALAEYYCAGDIKYNIDVLTDSQTIGETSVSSTVAYLILDKALDPTANYRLLATKNVANSYDVKMQDNWLVDFTTANQICKINQLSIDPVSASFNRKDEEKIFIAKPEFLNQAVNGAPAQELLKMPNSYDWSYNWNDGDVTVDIISVIPQSNTQRAVVQALGKNGDTSVGANIVITKDNSKDSTVGKTFSATSTISVFMCENPWPSINPNTSLGIGYFDTDGNSNDINIGKGWTNFKLFYCRDAGRVNDFSDDFSALNPVIIDHSGDSSGIFKEFFFSFNSATNKNSLGLRVYPNTNHLSITDWYNSQPWIPKGSPVAVTVGSADHVYEALQEGRTYYINGLNINGSDVYTNVYVLGFSDNPTAETLNVATQLLNNFTLNVNELDKNKIAALMRDFTRFKDLKIMSQKLTTSYNEKGYFPKLTESTQYGTYLPSYTNSKWQSWQLLGNALGYGMPIDPINQFYGCGSSTILLANGGNLGSFNSESCWNSDNSTFVCPTGSHVYQYETKGGTEAIVKADFEVTDMIWQNSLEDILNAANLTFQLKNSCVSSVQGIGGTCGDGLVGTGEGCEIGQTRYEDCLVDGYKGKQLRQCLADCSDFAAPGICVKQGKCGDGIKQDNETCDDGANNGNYGYCNLSCGGISSSYCGNLVVDSGKEVCDKSSLTHPSPAQYSKFKEQSCSWDCQSYDYCGDGKINTNYETCEASESCQVGRCSASSGSVSNKYCESDSDCQAEIACLGICELVGSNLECTKRSTVTKFCQGGPKDGISCNSTSQCIEDVKCENYVSGKKYCFAPGEKKWKENDDGTFKDSTEVYATNSAGFRSNGCGWDLPPSFSSLAVSDFSCLPLQKVETPIVQTSCGIDSNGDGNYKDSGEECDFGPKNGDIPSTPEYGKTATYCSLGCTQATISGPYCGDGKITDSEICDMNGAATIAATTYNGRFCLSPNYTEVKPTSETPCDMASCTSFVCPEGWRLCTNEAECPSVDITIEDDGGSPDDIFSVEIDGQKMTDIIPEIKDAITKQIVNTPDYPANKFLNIKNIPKGEHVIKIYNRTGGMSGTGRITYNRIKTTFSQTPFEKYTSLNFKDDWEEGAPKSTATIYETREKDRGSLPAKKAYIQFEITLPQECGTYWNKWFAIFSRQQPGYGIDQYPCVSKKNDPGYIVYKFTAQ